MALQRQTGINRLTDRHTHTRMHARTQAHTHTHTHTHTHNLIKPTNKGIDGQEKERKVSEVRG